jgi:citrate synthase
MDEVAIHPTDWLPAEAALQRLGIARQTLYAYVSRGLLRARPDPSDPKRSLYDRHGVETLVQRRRCSRSPRVVAASTIDFGEPVLTSHITQIAHGRLWYRGRDAVQLSCSATWEDVAAVLWDIPAFPALSASTYQPGRVGTPIIRCLRQVAFFAGRAGAADAPGALRAIGEAACDARADAPLHLVLSAAWGVEDEGADLIRRALVLCADHELNASTFAVRVVASTGAVLAHCLLAGLGALSGPRHGGMTDRVRGLLGAAPDTLAVRAAAGEELPGFGHRLYPEGDPRAAALLSAFPAGPACRRLFASVEKLTGLQPNIDAALVALEEYLALPDGSALAMFAVGRSAGWIAHALEQQSQGQLIRPRAVYAGVEPGAGKAEAFPFVLNSPGHPTIGDGRR